MQKKRLVAALTASLVVLSAAAGEARAQVAQDNEAQKAHETVDEMDDALVSLPLEQMIAALRTALAAKPGTVIEAEAEIEDGKVVCEVKILAVDNKAYEVEVDVASNKILSIELDEDGDEDEE